MTIDNVVDIKSINKTYNYSSRLPEKFESNFKYLNEYLEKQLYSNKIVIIALSDESKLKNIEKYLTVSTILTNENDLSKGKVNIINSNLDEGFEFDNYVVLTENELFKNRDKKTNYKNKFKYIVTFQMYHLYSLILFHQGQLLCYTPHQLYFYSHQTLLIYNY